jgi:hypothetical protein
MEERVMWRREWWEKWRNRMWREGDQERGEEGEEQTSDVEGEKPGVDQW